MEPHFFPLLALLFLFLRAANASLLPAQLYWNSMLPNTPLPQPLQQLLQSDAGIRSDFAQDFVSFRSAQIKYRVAYWAESKSFDSNKNVTVNSTTTYFLQDGLRLYKRINNVMFFKSPQGFNFLPHNVAESIPFSSSKLSEILSKTSIQPNSNEANMIKQTIEDCEAPGIQGEEKFCASSLESLVDYVVLKFGKRVQTLCNEVEEENIKKDYIIQKGIKRHKNKSIVCHKERYAYAVYYCHSIKDTYVYEVPMRGEDGTKAKAVVVCHLDTSDWNPKHFAFQVLNVKPGGPPICHFVNSDTIVWVPKGE